MQNWLTKSVVGGLFFSVVALAGCQKDEVNATISPSNSPTLTASTNSAVLTQANAATTAVTYSWTPISSFSWGNVDHPYTPTVTYRLQIDKKGNNFAAPAYVDLGTASPSKILTSDLDASLLALGAKSGTATDYEVRVQAAYAANAAVYSPTVALNATAYTFCPQPAKSWGLIGPAGVSWDTDVTLIYDCDSKTYSYTGTLKADEFKFRYNKDWTSNLGGKSSTGGALTQGGDNLKITKAGVYTIVLTPTIDATGSASGSFTIK